VLRSAERSGACVPLIEVAEAVKQAEESGTIVRHFPRHTIKFAQTPQGFHFAKILAAHRRAAREGASCVDDAEVYALYEGPVASVEGDITNRKITYPHDKEAEAAQ
jgi:2-C-methyl-D-erythritol 4-phosphate cytidylyltransferase